MISGYKFEAKRSPNGQSHKYHQQYHNARYCAKERGIDWQFTYDTWEAWWGDDIMNRGCKRDQLVMARNGDTGPYHPDNVHKVTARDNHKERVVNGGEQKRIASMQANKAKKRFKETINE